MHTTLTIFKLIQLLRYGITFIFLPLLDEMKWWHIIVIVVVVIFLIGVVLWITVGAMVANPPDGSKCTSFSFQSSFPLLPHFMGQKG